MPKFDYFNKTYEDTVPKRKRSSRMNATVRLEKSSK